MKKGLVLLALIGSSLIGLTGCNTDKKARITYGTLVDSTATELVYGALAQKVARKENLLIAVYDDSGVPCGCWTDFHRLLDQYVDQYDTVVYYIARSQFSEDSDKFGLTILTVGTDPTFALIKNGKKTNEYIYGKDNKPMFTTLDGLRNAIVKIARDPQFLLVNQDYLDDALFTNPKDKVVVHYIWSFCPDCLYCFPEVMVPYSEANEFTTKIWIIDLGIKGLLLNEDGSFEGTGIQTYVDFLKQHHMSKAGDDVFGYDRGFVPTTQVWEKGELKDMTVYFNDEVQRDGDKFKVTRSFYNSERAGAISYTDKVLEGMEVPESELQISEAGTVNESISWIQDEAAKYHTPLLKAFLDKYVK